MNCEVTWKWEHWKTVSERSGALTLVRFGQETRVDEINRMLDFRFPKPIQCTDEDWLVERLEYRGV